MCEALLWLCNGSGEKNSEFRVILTFFSLYQWHYSYCRLRTLQAANAILLNRFVHYLAGSFQFQQVAALQEILWGSCITVLTSRLCRSFCMLSHMSAGEDLVFSKKYSKAIVNLKGILGIHLQCWTMSLNCRQYKITSCSKIDSKSRRSKKQQLNWQIRRNLTNDHHSQYLMQSIVQYCRQHHKTLI